MTSLGSDYSLIEGNLCKTVYSWDFNDDVNPFAANNGFPGCNGVAPTVGDGVLKVPAYTYDYNGIQFKVKSAGTYLLSMKAKSDGEGATAAFYYGISGNIGDKVSLSDQWKEISRTHTITSEQFKATHWGNTGDIIRVNGGKNESKAFEIDELRVLKKATENDFKDIVSDNEAILKTTKQLIDSDPENYTGAQIWNIPADFENIPRGFDIKDYTKAVVVGKVYADSGINDNAQYFSGVNFNQDCTFSMTFNISDLENIGTITSQVETGVIGAIEIDSVTFTK